jgi:hypothetical protein
MNDLGLVLVVAFGKALRHELLGSRSWNVVIVQDQRHLAIRVDRPSPDAHAITSREFDEPRSVSVAQGPRSSHDQAAICADRDRYGHIVLHGEPGGLKCLRRPER